MHAGLGGLHRVTLVVNGRGRAGQVKNSVNLYIKRKRHVVTHQLEIRMADLVGDIGFAACKEVVYTEHIVAVLDKTITQMGTKKTGTAGD